MGLLVHVYEGRLGNGWKVLDSEQGDELAGPEAARQTLWGSEIIKSLGLTLLPTLDGHDIYADGENLVRLEQEINIVYSKVDLIAKHVPFDTYSILQIVRNIRNAIDRAKQIDGGVVIW